MNKHALALAVGLAVMQPQAVHALILGEVQIESELSQPLRARIDLHDIAVNDLPDLSVRVASENLFQRMGMERSLALNNLTLDTVLYGDQPTLLIHTRYPFNEPFLHVLLEVSHQNQVVVQEYMLMPELPKVQSQLRADTRRRYSVKRGDTLFKIASRFRYSGTNSNQMMLAILQRNPRAFVRGDGNRLKANVEMTIPARQVVTDVSPRQAQVFRAQLVKSKLSEFVLSKQPAAQPERALEALTEIDQARQHVQALKQKNATVEQRLTTAIPVEKTPTADAGEQSNDQLVSQLEVKTLKIAELQMRLARLNKKLLMQEAEEAQAIRETTYDKPASDEHVIDIIALTTMPSAASLSSENKLKETQAQPVATESRLNEPVTITTVETGTGTGLDIEKDLQTSPKPEASSAEPIGEPTANIPTDLPMVSDLLAQLNAVDAVQSEQSVSTSQEVSTSPATVTATATAIDVPGVETLSKRIYALLTSPWVLYLELAALVTLLGVWLYARHRRRQREWRLVDDVVRDLEIKRIEEGRIKMVWSKLVFAPDHWLIDLPESTERSTPTRQEHTQSQLPDVEQLEALLRHDKQPFKVPSEAVTQEVAAVNAVSVDQLPQEQDDQNDQVEALRRQIDEMQQMLNNLQQHRADLERQRDAA